MHVHVLADGNLIASHAILISLLFVFVNLGIIDFHFIHEFRFWHFVIFYNFKICGKGWLLILLRSRGKNVFCSK